MLPCRLGGFFFPAPLSTLRDALCTNPCAAAECAGEGCLAGDLRLREARSRRARKATGALPSRLMLETPLLYETTSPGPSKRDARRLGGQSLARALLQTSERERLSRALDS